MDVETFNGNGNDVVIGNCSACNEKKILINYMGESFCTRCIQKDEHLSAVIGWHG